MAVKTKICEQKYSIVIWSNHNTHTHIFILSQPEINLRKRPIQTSINSTTTKHELISGQKANHTCQWIESSFYGKNTIHWSILHNDNSTTFHKVIHTKKHPRDAFKASQKIQPWANLLEMHFNTKSSWSSDLAINRAHSHIEMNRNSFRYIEEKTPWKTKENNATNSLLAPQNYMLTRAKAQINRCNYPTMTRALFVAKKFLLSHRLILWSSLRNLSGITYYAYDSSGF